MKNSKSQFGFGILGIIILAGVIFLIYRVIVLTITKVDGINANVLVALIAGTVTITGYFITRYLEKRKLIEQQIREQKIPVYEEFMEFFFKLFKNTKDKKNIDSKELEDFFWKMHEKSILWLSDKTFKSYINWKNTSSKFADLKNKSQEENMEMLLLFEQLLLDFRKDIGHKNKNLESGDLLSLFINDWEIFKNKK